MPETKSGWPAKAESFIDEAGPISGVLTTPPRGFTSQSALKPAAGVSMDVIPLSSLFTSKISPVRTRYLPGAGDLSSAADRAAEERDDYAPPSDSLRRFLAATSPVRPQINGADPTLSDAFVSAMQRLGVQSAFGLMGGAVAAFCDALPRARMNVLHFRHETGAVFAAIESYFANSRPVLVFTTSGPGLTNAITGVAAARRDGAKLIMVSGSTSAQNRGRWAFQETSAYTMPVSGLFTSGPLFHYGVTVEQPGELVEVCRRLALGLQQPGGFVAHVSLPISIQSARDLEPLSTRSVSMMPSSSSDDVSAQCANMLRDDSFVIWVGFGARRSSRQILELAERTGAPVMCSPRGKGIFPEDHPQFLGVTGFGGHGGVPRYLTENRPAYILVLGTRLGEFTSFWDSTMDPEKGFIHVDLDPEVPGVAYPDSTTYGIQAEIGGFLARLLEHVASEAWPDGRLPSMPLEPVVSEPPRSQGLVRPDFLMAMIQKVIVEGSSAIVMTEAGNAFAWGTHSLRFATPGRYRVSTGFGSMGHAVTGILGATLASGTKAVAIAGDGAMLMNSEISTAVQYGIAAVWIVLNDSAYGMIAQGMEALGMTFPETTIPAADFVMIARGMGADGVRVEKEEEVVAALKRAMAAKGPFVVDVIIDPTVKAPSARRFDSLTSQTAPPPKTT